jgi:hypothetical protein
LKKKNKNKHLQLSNNISRRDFVNGSLVGLGVALLSPSLPVIAADKKQLAFSMTSGRVLVE